LKITRANKAGFCFGVRRAIRIAYERLKAADGKPVYTFGPLVHNPEVIRRLEKDGIRSIGQLNSEEPGHLLIRSHGVSPAVRKRAEEMGYVVTDATCPLVEKIHKIVRNLKKEGYTILVIGHSAHPEIIGIVGEVDEECIVIESVDEVRKLPRYKKLGVAAQTTTLWTKFMDISRELVGKAHECRIFNTICEATIEAQKSAMELAGRAGAMIIIGGRNSSNTRRLFEISSTVNPNSHHIEYPEELEPGWFEGIVEVGVTAGASTPDHIIEKVIERIREICSTSNFYNIRSSG